MAARITTKGGRVYICWGKSSAELIRDWERAKREEATCLKCGDDLCVALDAIEAITPREEPDPGTPITPLGTTAGVVVNVGTTALGH